MKHKKSPRETMEIYRYDSRIYQARIHTGVHRFTEINQIFHNKKYILLLILNLESTRNSNAIPVSYSINSTANIKENLDGVLSLVLHEDMLPFHLRLEAEMT